MSRPVGLKFLGAMNTVFFKLMGKEKIRMGRSHPVGQSTGNRRRNRAECNFPT